MSFGFNTSQGPPAGAASGEAQVITDWDDRPSNPSDGDAVTFMGLSFSWLASPGCWIPTMAYDNTPADVNFIDGDESSGTLTSRGWTLTASGSTPGVISHDVSGKIQFDTSGNSDNIAAASTSITGDGSFWFMGRGRIISGPGENRSGAGLNNSVTFDCNHSATLTMFTLKANSHASANPRGGFLLQRALGSVISHTTIDSHDPSVEAMYVVLTTPGVKPWAVVYHETLGILATSGTKAGGSTTATSGTNQIIVGKPYTLDTVNDEWRDISCGRFG